MRKAKFGLVVFPGDLKDNLRAVPLGRVFDKVNLAVQGATFFPGTNSVIVWALR